MAPSNLIKRTNHTMVSVYVKKLGTCVFDFKHFLFGGLVLESGMQVPSNDVVEVRTRILVKERFYDEANWQLGKGINEFTIESLKAKVSFVACAGVLPMPRCDHSAQLISKNRYMLIYGGRNEQAYGNGNNQPAVSLDDIMLFDFDKSEWTGVR